MSRGTGGYHADSRLALHLVELQVSTGVYTQLDAAEDRLIERLLDALRRLYAALPARLAELERWERAWRAADGHADGSVREIGGTARAAARLAARVLDPADLVAMDRTAPSPHEAPAAAA